VPLGEEAAAAGAVAENCADGVGSPLGRGEGVRLWASPEVAGKMWIDTLRTRPVDVLDGAF
jgi:hypothetical protein